MNIQTALRYTQRTTTLIRSFHIWKSYALFETFIVNIHVQKINIYLYAFRDVRFIFNAGK